MIPSPPRIEIGFDGGTRPNPGLMTIGVWYRRNGALLHSVSQVMGQGTNNMAEWHALLTGLRLVLEEPQAAQVNLRGDARLVVDQFYGRIRISAPHLQAPHRDAHRLVRTLRERGHQIRIEWVPREQNAEADALTQQAFTQAQSTPRVSPATGGALTEERVGQLIAQGQVDILLTTCRHDGIRQLPSQPTPRDISQICPSQDVLQKMAPTVFNMVSTIVIPEAIHQEVWRACIQEEGTYREACRWIIRGASVPLALVLARRPHPGIQPTLVPQPPRKTAQPRVSPKSSPRRSAAPDFSLL